MSDPKKPNTLLAQLSWRFRPRMEELAVEALAYMLDRYSVSSRGLAQVVKRFVSDMRLSSQPFKTEVIAPDGTRPDVLQEGDDGSERLFIEAKFYAPLTRSQPVRYLNRLPDEGISALMFLAPVERVEELWGELLYRLDDNGMPYANEGASRCVAIEGTAKHLFITDWTALLDSMEKQLKDSACGRAELRQLRGLVQFAKFGEGKSDLAGKELVNRVTEIGKRSGWLHTKGFKAVPRPYGYGRYVQIGRHHVLGVWLGVNLDLFEDYGSTQLWVEGHSWSDDRRRWNELVRPTLMERMSPDVHEEGEGLWVAVVPGGGTRADSYAAALEPIAAIVDELAGQ